MKKRINKILWYGDELKDGKAKEPTVSVNADGLDGLNEGEIYIANNEKDPALFIRTSSGKVARIGDSKLFSLKQDSEGNYYIHTPYALASDSTLSSLGKGSSEGETGSGASALYQLVDVLPDGDKVSGAEEGNVLMYDATQKKWYGKKVDIPDVDFSELEGQLVEVNSLIKALQEKDVEHSEAIAELQDADKANAEAIKAVDERIDTLVGGDASAAIDTFNEVVAFLKDIEDTATLEGILAVKADKSTVDALSGTVTSEVARLDGLIGGHTTSIATINTTLTTHKKLIDVNATNIGKNATAIAEIQDTLADWFTLEDGVLHSKYGLASDSAVSSLGKSSSSGGSGVSYDRLDDWTKYDASAGAVLSATLGYDLKTRLDNLDLGDFDLSGYLTVVDAQKTYATITDLNSGLAGKQDTVSDLATIRTNALLGKEAHGWGNHASAGYATQTALNNLGDALDNYKTIVADTYFTKDSFTKANIKSTLGISDWALASVKPSYKTSEVTEDTRLYFTNERAVAALKSVTDALSARIKVYEDVLEVVNDTTGKYLHALIAFASDSAVSSLGVGSSSGGGGSVDWGAVPTNIIPATNNAYTLGAEDYYWRKLFANGLQFDTDVVGLIEGGDIRFTTDLVTFVNDVVFNNKPTVNGFAVATMADLSDYYTKTQVHSYVAQEINTFNENLPVIPTKTSQLTNDSGFVLASSLGTAASKSWSGVATTDSTNLVTSAWVESKIANLNIPDTSSFAKTTDLGNYFPLAGGKTITGKVTISSAGSLEVQGNAYIGGTLYKGLNTNDPYATQSWVTSQGYTKNTGTVTSVAIKMNDSVKGTVTSSGTIDLGTVLTAHQSLSDYYTKTQVDSYVASTIESYAADNIAGKYLLSSGGTLYNDNSDTPLTIKGDSTSGYVKFSSSSNVNFGSIGVSDAGSLLLKNSNGTYVMATQSWVTSQGYTKNVGTVTSVKINGATKNPTNGVVDLGTITADTSELESQIEELDKNKQPLITAANKLAYSLISGTPTIPSAVTVVNNLTSTSTTSALSAAQGKALNDSLNSLNDSFTGLNNYLTANGTAGQVLTKKSSGYEWKSFTVDWSNVSSKPTTLSGYGITDGARRSQLRDEYAVIYLDGVSSVIGRIIMYSSDLHLKLADSNWSREWVVLDSSNFSDYALPLSGGIVDGNIQIGKDDNQDWKSINFYRGGIAGFVGSAVDFMQIGVGKSYLNVGSELAFVDNGTKRTVIHSGNIGNQQVWKADRAEKLIYSDSTIGLQVLSGGKIKPSNQITFDEEGKYGIFRGNYYSSSGSEQDIAIYTPKLFLGGAGNVLIGTTTDSGYKLYVNGDSYVNGSLTVSGDILPSSTDTQSLGSTSSYWKNLYVGIITGHYQSGDVVKFSGSINANEGNVSCKSLTVNGSSLSTLITEALNTFDEENLGAAASYGVTTSVTSGSNSLVTSGGVASALGSYVGNSGNQSISGKLTVYDFSSNGNASVYGSITIAMGGLTAANGTVSAKVITQTSDERLKSIHSYSERFGVKDIAGAPVAYFAWKDGSDTDEHLGTIAQYWKQIAPQCVYGKEGSMSMDYSTLGLVSSIINAREIVKHESEIDTLKRRVKELEDRLAAYEAA